MADIFARQETSFEGAFTSDATTLTLGKHALGIVQNAQFQYGQSVNRIYSLSKSGNSVPVYYVGGRAQGTLSIARVIGPKSEVLSQLYKDIGNVCNAGANELVVTFTDGSSCLAGSTTGPGLPIRYTLKGCVLTNVGVSVGAQDMIINENMQIMFATALV